jgi:hypothetical protein
VAGPSTGRTGPLPICRNEPRSKPLPGRRCRSGWCCDARRAATRDQAPGREPPCQTEGHIPRKGAPEPTKTGGRELPFSEPPPHFGRCGVRAGTNRIGERCQAEVVLGAGVAAHEARRRGTRAGCRDLGRRAGSGPRTGAPDETAALRDRPLTPAVRREHGAWAGRNGPMVWIGGLVAAGPVLTIGQSAYRPGATDSRLGDGPDRDNKV